MAKADNVRSHSDGSAHLGRGKTRDLRANVGTGESGRGGKIGTRASVSAFDGASRAPGKPPKLATATRPSGPDSPKGKDAGGRDNMRANGKRYAASPMSVPESGSAKARPAGVRSHDGKSVPKNVAKAPK